MTITASLTGRLSAMITNVLAVAALATAGTIAVPIPAAATSVPSRAPSAAHNLTVAGQPNETPQDRTLANRGWIKVRATVDGARIRAVPVDGKIIGLIPYGAHFWALCTSYGRDGWLWGWSDYRGRKGWVRADLWNEVAVVPQVGRCA